MIVLLVGWCTIASPLVFVGAHFGYKQEAIEFPVKTSNIPRQIPNQRWFMGAPFTLMTGGILPFALCYVELFFIMTSLWDHTYFTTFGFLLFVFCILLITCAEITILVIYFQLRNEDYHWWWRCFGTAGSVAVYVFIYCLLYFYQWKDGGVWAYVFYFGYMGLSTLGLFLMMGFVGVASSLWFNISMFGSLKVD
jgi:transmembrane 9 superfamily member 2/4